MFVSIIMPVLNEAPALTSFLQHHVIPESCELIIVDGGSSDGGLGDLPGRVRVIQSARGRARQMNAGAEAACGEVLFFLHVDSVLPHNWLEFLRQFWHSDKAWGRFDVQLTGSHTWFRVIEFMMNQRSRFSGIATGDQGIFVLRSEFARLSGYADIPLMEDIEISRRLKRVSSPFCISEQLTTSSRRWETYGILRTILLMWRLRLYYFLGVPPEHLARFYK